MGRRLIEHAQICPIVDGVARDAAALLARVAQEREEAERVKEAFREKYNACKIRELDAERRLAEARAALEAIADGEGDAREIAEQTLRALLARDD